MIDWFGEAQVVSEDGQREASLLAQCADVTDEEDEAEEKNDSGASTTNSS